VAIVSGVVADATTSPDGATRVAFTPLVPTSRPRKTDSVTTAHSEQDLHRQLVEPLVGVAVVAHRGQIELLALNRRRELLRELEARAALRATLSERAEERPDLRVGVEQRDLLLEDEIRAHAPGGEIPHALLILGAIGVAVEVPHPGPLRILEQLDEEEGGLRILAAETMILVVPAGLLRVEVDVEQLTRLERLGHAVREVEPRHRVVRDFGVEADHLRVVERVDEGERVTDRREEDVAARLVRLRLERELVVVSL
jgi:hypothetical protein